ncbi:Fpg/Nei family DNA glycosylase [soil metagenome]
MPEGHVIHRLAHQLDGVFSGQVVRVSSPQGRFAEGAQRMDGATWSGADALGKHLLIAFTDRPEQVHVHLGIFGKVTIARATSIPPVGLIRLRLESATYTVDLRGPTTCELLLPDEVEALFARIGPDPLRPDADPDRAWRRIKGSRTSIAVLLMDQAVLSGVGNIYRAEVLFRHRVPPTLPGNKVTRRKWIAMWEDLVYLMALGVKDGQIDTVRPEHEPEAMGREARDDRHGGEVYVYRRAGMPCLVCSTPIATRELAARNLFWCPSCQRRR